MTAIKAIETKYAGCLFRSRLEARWAVVFDHLGIRWDYEPEGLDIDGTRYLPDFRLPGMDGLFVEVKPNLDKPRDFQKPALLAAQGKRVVVLAGIPEPGKYGPHHLLLARNLTRPGVQMFAVSLFESDADTFTFLPFGWPRSLQPDLSGKHDHADVAGLAGAATEGGWIQQQTCVANAFAAGRSARFEFGAAG